MENSMYITVIKRDGTKEEFDIEKIQTAVAKAFKSVGKEVPNAFVRTIDDIFSNISVDEVQVEEIQDMVESALMNWHFQTVAKSYILYRNKHKELREAAKKKCDFIHKFVNSDNTANATIDDNSNVGTKSIGVLNAEIHKEDNKNTNLFIWKKEMNKLYPDFPLKQMEEDFNTVLYVHDFSSQVLMPYCLAVSMYPFLLNGLKDLGGKSAVPKNIDSFCGIFVNLVFALASEVKGAVATPEFLMYMDYFCRKEWGEDYYKNYDVVISADICQRKKTVGDQIDQYFQQVTYSINQIAGSRGMQSPFTNFSFFDKYFFEGMFGEFKFPDGTAPQWESTNWLQQRYLHWLNQERLKCILTFPVCSYACLIKDGEFVDRDTYHFICKEYAEGNSFFLYMSSSVDSLSSCCFSKDTKVLWKNSYDGVKYTTLEELHNMKWEPNKKNLRIFHNGSWVNGKSIKLPNRNMYKVTTYNNKEFIMSDNHINITYDGEKATEKLTTEDYLMFNTSTLSPVTENDEHLTYEQGLLVGLFIGDGTFGNYVCQDGSVHSFTLSLNEEKWNKVKDSLSKLGDFKLHTIYNNVYPVYCYSKELTTFIAKWTTNEPGKTTALNKSLNLNCLLQSVEFRRGILDGWYITDGGNTNRCYTISKQLIDNMEVLCTSLGLQTIINVSDRTDEAVIIRGQEYDRDYPLYCLRWYSEGNHRCNKTKDKSWKKKNNSIYWKIKAIEPVDYNEDIYCIQCSNQDEPYFTLPSGLITHNCRLANSISENSFNFTNGQIGVMTGSKQVITLDLNRIIQDWVKQLRKKDLETGEEIPYNMEDIKENIDGDVVWIREQVFNNPEEGFEQYLIKILERVYKYHTAYNSMLHWAYEHNLFPAYKAGFINLDKQYLTIGINGLNQAAEFLGIECNNNEKYKEFCKSIFGIIKKQNELHRTTKERYNTEQVPAESAAIKLYGRDKRDGYWVPEDTNLYASYIFKPNDPNISVLDKITLHSSQFAADQLDGGSACHLNLDSHLSVPQYAKLLNFAAKVGCKYLTFNVPNSECENCGYITKVPIVECPRCHSNNISYWDRIIGYITKIKDWSKGRQIEQKTRVYNKDVNTEDA